jgi:hypothetical protein
MLVVLFITTIISCQERINSNSEKDFKLSRVKMEKELNKEQKVNLEKAFRVLVLKAMALKWEEPEKYKGKSFNEISLKMIDRLTYSSIVDLAEDFLQESNKKDIEKRLIEIKNLEKQKREILSIQKKLNLFKIGYLEINEVDWFGTMTPELEIDYTYLGKNNLKGTVEITLELRRKLTKEAIALQTWGFG